MMEKRTKLILLTHGSWGEELWKAGEMIVGKIRFCKALGLMPEDAVADYRVRLEKELEGETKVLILADIKGGTPSNVAAVYAKRNEHIHALSGLSLEMLLAADRLRNEYSGRALAGKIVEEMKEKLTDLKE